MLFRDLPVPDAHELVSIHQTVEGGDYSGTSGQGTFTIAEYRAYRDRSQSLVGLLAHASPRETTLGGDAPRRIFGSIVSCDYFAVLEQPPAVGRALNGADCEPGAEPVVLLGHDLWTTTFGADAGIVGRTVELDRNPFTVVGVAGEDAYGASPLRAGYFAPLSAEPLLWPGQSRFQDERHRWLYLIGRRDAAAGIEQVQAELAVIAAQIDQTEPGRATTLGIARSKPNMMLPPDMQRVATGTAAILLVAFGMILLIACANVANLVLARGTTRAREIGIRLSLGASRARIVRQLLAESVLISITGGLLGSAIALWLFQSAFAVAIPAIIPPEVPGVVPNLDLSPDFRVLWYALALTLATGILFGLAPALHVSRQDVNTVVKQNAGSDRSGGRLRGILVGTQVAVSMVLMIATGLVLRGLQATYTIEPGFTYENVAHLSFGTDGGPGEILDQRLMDEVAELPGVESVAFATQTPLGEARMGTLVRLPGESEDEGRMAERDLVTADYFSLLEIPVLRGRTFTPAEIANAYSEAGTRPAVVSETTARNLWGESDPIGRTLLRHGFPGDAAVTLTVVGMVADAQLSALGRVDPYYVFEPRQPGGELLVKSRNGFDAIASELRAIVQARDPSLAFRVLPLEGNLAYFRGLSGIITTLFSGLGLLALVLASVGIYGVVAYTVARRYREIGIRMALGAEARNVLGLILRRTMRPVVIGAGVGIVAAVAVSRMLSLVLFGVSPTDPAGLAGSALLVVGVALAAGVIGARPATRAEPTSVLRYE